VELVLKNSSALKDLKGELWWIPIAERAFLEPDRAMAIECAGRCGGGVCLDNAVVTSQVWLAFVLIDRILNRYDDPHGRYSHCSGRQIPRSETPILACPDNSQAVLQSVFVPSNLLILPE